MSFIVDQPRGPRRRLSHAVPLALCFAVTVTAMPMADAADRSPLGTWINDTGRGAIEIKPCGDKLCGHVVWVKDPAETAKGCGRQIIGDVVKTAESRWDRGWIYSPERKKSYSVVLQPLEDGTLRVIGNADSRYFSRTMVWAPAAADLQRCDQPATRADTLPPAATPIPTATRTEADALPTASKDGAQTTNATAGAQAVEPSNPPLTRDANSPRQDTASDKPRTDDLPSTDPQPKSGMLICDINLDKVFTRTSTGRCKLDLPWIKLDVRCDRD